MIIKILIKTTKITIVVAIIGITIIIIGIIITTLMIIIRSSWYVHKVWYRSNECKQYLNTRHKKQSKH